MQTFERKIEAAKPVPSERVSPTLQNHCTRLKCLHHLCHHLQTDGKCRTYDQGIVGSTHGRVAIKLLLPRRLTVRRQENYLGI